MVLRDRKSEKKGPQGFIFAVWRLHLGRRFVLFRFFFRIGRLVAGSNGAGISIAGVSPCASSLSPLFR